MFPSYFLCDIRSTSKVVTERSESIAHSMRALLCSAAAK